jgi:hypothetical protein
MLDVITSGIEQNVEWRFRLLDGCISNTSMRSAVGGKARHFGRASVRGLWKSGLNTRRNVISERR